MFFEMAMRVCEENLQDVDLGQTVNRLFHKGVNHKFVGSAMGESVY